MKMTTGRTEAAIVKMNSTSLWITGGRSYGWKYLSSSEFVQVEGSMPGPELPITLTLHTMINIRHDLTMVIAGETLGNFSIAKTFNYHHNQGNWFDGPELNQGRQEHAVGIVTDEVTQEKLVIVTAGCYYHSNSAGYGQWHNLKSTEILISDVWSLGEKRAIMARYRF